MEILRNINSVFYDMLGINFYIVIIGIICYYFYNYSIFLKWFITSIITDTRKYLLYDTLTEDEKDWFNNNYKFVFRQALNKHDWKTARKLKKLCNTNTDDCYCYLLELLKIENIPE